MRSWLGGGLDGGEEFAEGRLFLGDDGLGTAELEEPGLALVWHHGAEQTHGLAVGRAGGVDEDDLEAVDVEALDRGLEAGLGDGWQADLAAPAVDVGKQAAG